MEQILGNKKLRNRVSVDWKKRENARAKMRNIIPGKYAVNNNLNY